MTRVGLPILQGGVFFAVIYLVIGALVGETGGAAAQAALGIGHRGEAFAYVLASGFSVAASSLVGRWLGARDAAAAEHAAWRTVAHCAAYCGIWALVLLVFGDAIASLFLETGTDAHALATSYYRITALCLVPQAFQIVLDGAAGGAGKTLPPMVVMVTASLLRVALAWVVAVPLGLGIDAIWWVLAITAILRGIAMTVWFRRGTWKSQSV
jgi:Na+-driven multidrug efflux pump